MNHLAATIVTLFSILFPTKTWYAPSQPLTVKVKADAGVTLVLTSFDGKPVDAKGPASVSGDAEVNLRDLFPTLDTPGTYVLFAVPNGKAVNEFVGTPLVVEVRADKRRGAPPGPMVVKVSPLQYVVMHTKAGDMTMAFYYDVAPSTVSSFLSLTNGGYFDGLTFHRIVPGFVIQGGDPRGDGTGGPGYNVQAEFNERPHEEGALSMARNGDPNEAPGVLPRAEFANSAGSQFFVCLDYNATKQLDRKYTVFGKVVDGMAAVKKIAATPLADPEAGRPATPQVIEKAEVKSVTPEANPYATIFNLGNTTAAAVATQPAK